MSDVMSNSYITNPHTLWLGSRCFRVVGDVGGQLRKPSNMLENQQEVEVPLQDVEPAATVNHTNSASSSWNIRKLMSGVMEANIPVPRVYHGYICGPRNCNREDVEKETRTKIILPKYNDPPNNIVVVGEHARNVESACVRISLMVLEKRNKSFPSHFLSVAVNTTSVKKNFLRFKQQALQFDGVDELLFQNPMKLHITLGMFTILDVSEQSNVISVLQSFIKKQLSGLKKKPALELHLRGVKIMHDDPKNVDVLYAHVEEGEAASFIRDIAAKIKAVLEPTGCLSWSSSQMCSDIKLHVTLMNTKFKRKRLISSQHNASSIKDKDIVYSFDATSILEHLQDFDFGWVPVRRLLVAVCGSEDKEGAHGFILDIPVASPYCQD